MNKSVLLAVILIFLFLTEVSSFDFDPFDFTFVKKVTVKRKLVRSSTWNQACNSAVDCDDPNGYKMLCQDKKCVCGNNTEMDPESGNCVAKLGEYCRDTGYFPFCVKNAVCKSLNDDQKPKCECLPSFYENSYKQCVHGWRMPCQGDDECDRTRGLGCSPLGRCQCLFKSDQSYDSKSGSCHSKAGGRCVKEEHSECPDTFQCLEGKLGTICTCPLGSNLTRNIGVQKCTLGFEASCVSNSSLSLECDTSRSLACIEGTCKCHHGFVYDNKMDRCVGLEGARCSTLEQSCMFGTTCNPDYRGAVEGLCRSIKDLTMLTTGVVALIAGIVFMVAIVALLAWVIYYEPALDFFRRKFHLSPGHILEEKPRSSDPDRTHRWI